MRLKNLTILLSENVPLKWAVPWLVALGAGSVILWVIAAWFNQTYAAGVGWIIVTTLILAGSLGLYFYQWRQQRLAACSINPRVSPLQISGLAAEVLGVQLLLYAGSLEFNDAFPLLDWWAWPYIFIIGGLAILGWYSLSCSCHDEVLGRKAD